MAATTSTSRWSAWPRPGRGRVLAGGRRRRGLHLRGRRLLRLDRVDAPQPPGGGHGRDAGRAAGTGWWPRTAGSSPSGTPGSSARPGRCTSTARWWAWPRRRTAGGYWLVAADGGLFCFGDAVRGSGHRTAATVGGGDGRRPSAGTGSSRPTAASTPSGTAPFFGSVYVPPMAVRWWPSTPDTTGATPGRPASSPSPSTGEASPSPATPSGPRRRPATPSTPSISTWPPGSRPSSRPKGPPW